MQTPVPTLVEWHKYPHIYKAQLEGYALAISLHREILTDAPPAFDELHTLLDQVECSCSSGDGVDCLVNELRPIVDELVDRFNLLTEERDEYKARAHEYARVLLDPWGMKKWPTWK